MAIERATAYKMRIGEILAGEKIFDGEQFNFIELGNKKIRRVNLVANIIDRYEGGGEGKYLSFTLDDASGQIRIKIFGDDVEKFKDFGQGDTVMIIGVLRHYNNELYILPEIIRKLQPEYLLVRKLELEKKEENKVPENKEESKAIKDKIIEMVKGAEKDGGIEVDKIIMELKASPSIINEEIKKLLEEGLAYEPRPGKIRYLG